MTDAERDLIDLGAAAICHNLCGHGRWVGNNPPHSRDRRRHREMARLVLNAVLPRLTERRRGSDTKGKP